MGAEILTMQKKERLKINNLKCQKGYVYFLLPMENVLIVKSNLSQKEVMLVSVQQLVEITTIKNKLEIKKSPQKGANSVGR